VENVKIDKNNPHGEIYCRIMATLSGGMSPKYLKG
jgi:hypothetical protein